MVKKSNGKRAAIYVRVSREDQNFENQIPSLQRIAEARGLEVVEIFSEKISGARDKASRPALTAVVEGAQRGEYGTVLVWAIDRLGRSMQGVVDTVLGLDRIGVSVISHQESWLDMHSPVRPLLLSIFAWVAEQERNRNISRTHEGLDRARAEGKSLGRPRVTVDMDTALRLRKDGISIINSAQRMGIGVGTLNNALRKYDAERAAAAAASSAGPKVRRAAGAK